MLANGSVFTILSVSYSSKKVRPEHESYVENSQTLIIFVWNYS